MKIIIALNDKDKLKLAFDVILCSESDFTAYNDKEKLIADVEPLDFDETPLSQYKGNADLFNDKAVQRKSFFDTVLDPAYEELLLKPLPQDRFCNIQLLTKNVDGTNGFRLTPFISPSDIQLLWTTYYNTAVDDEEDTLSQLQRKYQKIHEAIGNRLPEITELIASTPRSTPRSIPLAPTVQPQQEVKEEVTTPTEDKYDLAKKYWADYDKYTKNMEQRLRFVLQELKDIYSYVWEFRIPDDGSNPIQANAVQYRDWFTHSFSNLIFKALKEELCTVDKITSLIEEYAVNRFDKVIFTGYLTEVLKQQKAVGALQARKRGESNGQGRAAEEPTQAVAGLDDSASHQIPVPSSARPS